MTSTDTGSDAENAVASYIQTCGYKIIDRNWRTRWCEIDIIAKKNNTIYFIEVKYRSSNNWGEGLDYIGKRKIKQMQFAAELWLSLHDVTEDVLLSAASVNSNGHIELIEEI